MIADEVDLDHQYDEDTDPFQDLLPQEDIEDHSLQGKEGRGHHHLDAPEDHVQNLLARGKVIKMMRQQKVKMKQKPQQMVRRFLMKTRKP